MNIIPTINCPDSECVAEKMKKAAGFLPAGGWVQIDIADGKFTFHKTWNEPAELKIENLKLKINIEVHLMVENPEKVIDGWIKAGAKRIIIHLEAIKDLRFKIEDLKNEARGIELGLAINPDTVVEKAGPYLESIRFVQLLAVTPGKSGQKFDTRILDKIKFLKEKYPDVIIEVDGGIEPETAKLCKEAGADILVAGSYIWESANPEGAYEELISI